MDIAQGTRFLRACRSTSQKGGEQTESRGLEIKAQGARQQDASGSQIHHGRRDCHVDRVARESSRGGRIPGLRLQQFQQSPGYVLPAGS
jgi:hypothetical protein